MPFARHSGYSFSMVSVSQNAPTMGGIYGLSNAAGWIYIRAVENIQAALLEHLTGAQFRSVTGFTFEVCDPGQRTQRCKRLIEELHPTSGQW
jgi:hypothetical protein